VVLREASFSTPRTLSRHEHLARARGSRTDDDRIHQQSQGRKDLRDALVPFWFKPRRTSAVKIEELAPLFQQAAGVDVSEICQHWLQPLER
jgi:hypothetical protein